MTELTQERLKELLHYDPETGVFTWKVNKGTRGKKGNTAGTRNSGGYLKVTISSKIYLLHRLAFLYMEGVFPPELTDHIDGVRDNNKWTNLRAVSPQGNSRNTKIHSRNTSRIMGVGYAPRGCNFRWQAYIREGGKSNVLGYYMDFFEACCARKSAEARLGYHENHGRVVD